MVSWAQMTGMSLKSAQAAVDAASLVFAHSIVDAAAVGFLRIAAMASPGDWEPFVDKRKWSVVEVREFGYKRLYRDILMKELKHIERNTSLPEKGQRLRQSGGYRLEQRRGFDIQRAVANPCKQNHFQTVMPNLCPNFVGDWFDLGRK